MSRSRRSAFTLVEILVVIAILGILAAIVVPAVMYARQSAGRLACAANLRQIGVGVTGYEEAHRCYPPQYLWGGGIGRSGWGPHVPLLPYVGAETTYDQFNVQRDFEGQNTTATAATPAVYLCPSDGTPQDNVAPPMRFGTAHYNYSMCIGNGFFVADRDMVVTSDTPAARCNGLFPPQTLRAGDVTDGLSRTAAFAERLHGGPSAYEPAASDQWRPRLDVTCTLGPAVQTPNASYEACLALDAPQSPSPNNEMWTMDMGYTHKATPNRISCFSSAGSWDSVFTVSSTHAEGANVVFADGHVDFVADGVDLEVWRAAATRDGGESTAGL